MKIVKDYDRGEEYIDTEARDLDGENILVGNADGFGSCDVTVGGHTMRWADLDKLKEAISIAEKSWRAKLIGLTLAFVVGYAIASDVRQYELRHTTHSAGRLCIHVPV